MRRNANRLGVRDAAAYADLFDERSLEVRPAAPGQRPGYEVSVAKIGDDDPKFEIWIPSQEGQASPDCIAAARSILAHVVAMDDAARAIPSDEDYDEFLAYVTVQDHTTVMFTYYASTVNTEWEVGFTRDDRGGWRLQDWFASLT